MGAPRVLYSHGMPVVSEVLHPRGLSFAMQRKVVVLRDVKKKSWPDIAASVRNLGNESPSVSTVKRCYRSFSARRGRVRTKYDNCGRHPHKVTKDIESFLVTRLRHLRLTTVCSARTLQHEVARKKGVKLSISWVQKVLAKKGYRWLPRRQKRKYSAKARAGRVAFAKKILAMGVGGLHKRLSLAMDGVVLTLPPVDPTDRLNFCRQGEAKMWRKPTEGLCPALAGDDPFGKQVPLARAVPMWGGCSATGFAPVLFHKTKKVSVPEWTSAVQRGILEKALRMVRSQKQGGHWLVLCDNESFLRAAPVSRAHKRVGVRLLKIPPKSPDLNPVERFWAWLRKKLRKLDLEDAMKKKKTLTKALYSARVKRVLKTKKAHAVAAACTKGRRKVCKEVLAKKGAATHG